MRKLIKYLWTLVRRKFTGETIIHWHEGAPNDKVCIEVFESVKEKTK